MTSNDERLRLLSRVFSRSVFYDLANRRGVEALSFLVKHGIARRAHKTSQTFSDFVNSIWAQLFTEYRQEYVYKNVLASRLIFGRHSPRTTAYLLEFSVGRSIADVVIVNGTSTAYEIKTEFDSSRRVKTQTKDYLRVFDKVSVVTHPRGVLQLLNEVEASVGILILLPNGSLTTYRSPASNLANVNVQDIFRCLRRTEYVTAIKQYFGEFPDLPNGIIRDYCEQLFLQFSPERAHEILVTALRARTTDEKSVNFVCQLPQSLKAVGYATPLTEHGRNNVLELLRAPSKLLLV
jgi:hypothetical protein